MFDSRVVDAFDAVVVEDAARCVAEAVVDRVHVERDELVADVLLQFVQRRTVQSAEKRTKTALSSLVVIFALLVIPGRPNGTCSTVPPCTIAHAG